MAQDLKTTEGGLKTAAHKHGISHFAVGSVVHREQEIPFRYPMHAEVQKILSLFWDKRR